jgi:hypothetical protein
MDVVSCLMGVTPLPHETTKDMLSSFPEVCCCCTVHELP